MATIAFEGYVSKTPEVKYSKDGKPYARLRVLWSELDGKGDNGKWRYTPSMLAWVTLFGYAAENAAATIRAKDRVAVFGDVKPSEWESDKGPRMQLNVVARSVGVVPPKADTGGNGGGSRSGGWSQGGGGAAGGDGWDVGSADGWDVGSAPF